MAPWPNVEGLLCDRCQNRYPFLLVVEVYDRTVPGSSDFGQQRWCHMCVTNRGGAIVESGQFPAKNADPV